MYNYILFQNVYSFFSFVFAIIVTCLYKNMNDKATKKEQGAIKSDSKVGDIENN